MLVLASASPRRSDLLRQIGLVFETVPAHIDETQHQGESPGAYVKRLAVEKARAVQALRPQATVVGADTTVDLGGVILGKPQNLEEAASMLRSLSGRTHTVHTGIAVVTPTIELSHVETTAVAFDAIAESDLTAYLSTGDSLDKAGAYGIQGFAARWISRIEGDFFNVMGLPLAATVRLLRQSGYAGL